MARTIHFLRNSLDKIKTFPDDAIDRTGHELNEIQEGREPSNWKPMPTIGTGVREIRISVKEGAFRTIYVAKYEEAIYVLHAFHKKTQKTAKKDLELARSRLKELLQRRK